MTNESSQKGGPQKYLTDRYVGERKEQHRHGHGIYAYENKFFKYQGQWHRGLKHGHGRLTMGDGGFYEGTFVKGEIEGHGYRFYGHSGDSYTGQFQEGERHGQGVLKTAKGVQYEGTWVQGKMEGLGILSEPDGAVFEGEFYNNKKHGEGMQTYSCPNTYYEGGWVEGKRHGQGIFRNHDGTIYNGQWRSDVYHGEGAMVHSSGVNYSGMWINGKPAVGPVSMKCTAENNELVVEQGKTFDVQLACVDSNGALVTVESGRSLMIQASIPKGGARKFPQLTRIASSQNIESKLNDISEALLPYELLQVPSEDEAHSTNSHNNNLSCIPEMTSPVKTALTEPLPNVHSSKQVNINDVKDLHTSSMVLLLEKSPSPVSELSKLETPLSKVETKSLSSMSRHSMFTDEFSLPLVSPSKVLVKEGIAVFKDLFLPPPPSPDLNDLFSTSHMPSSLNDISTTNKKFKMPMQPISVTAKVNTGRQAISRLNEREKLILAKQEKFCAPGTYILKIHEVTDPPFMESRLLDLFVQVKIVPQKAASRGIGKNIPLVIDSIK